MKDTALRPIIPQPPDDYSRKFISDYLNRVDLFFREILSAGGITLTALRLLNFPSSASGLPEGSVFNDGGTLKVVMANVANVEGRAMRGRGGSVTVTIT